MSKYSTKLQNIKLIKGSDTIVFPIDSINPALDMERVARKYLTPGIDNSTLEIVTGKFAKTDITMEFSASNKDANNRPAWTHLAELFMEYTYDSNNSKHILFLDHTISQKSTNYQIITQKGHTQLTIDKVVGESMSLKFKNKDIPTLDFSVTGMLNTATNIDPDLNTIPDISPVTCGLTMTFDNNTFTNITDFELNINLNTERVSYIDTCDREVVGISRETTIKISMLNDDNIANYLSKIEASEYNQMTINLDIFDFNIQASLQDISFGEEFGLEVYELSFKVKDLEIKF